MNNYEILIHLVCESINIIGDGNTSVTNQSWVFLTSIDNILQ